MSWTGLLGLADLAVLACRNAFGVSVAYAPRASDVPETITAVFDDPHQVIVIEDSIANSRTAPRLMVRADDLTTTPPRVEDTAVVEGQEYMVVDVQDGAQRRSWDLELVESDAFLADELGNKLADEFGAWVRS
jgi:hypothetical protein